MKGWILPSVAVTCPALPGRHCVSRDLPSLPRSSRLFQGRVLLSDEQGRCGRVCVWVSAARTGPSEALGGPPPRG